MPALSRKPGKPSTKSAKDGSKRGRPFKLDDEIKQAILDNITAGNTIEKTTEAAGVSTSVFYRWMQRGEEPGAVQELRDFVEAVKRAKAESETRCVQIIANAALNQWQAAAWLLERRNPTQWAMKRQDVFDGKSDATVRIVFVNDWRTPAKIEEMHESKADGA
jgi:transposase